MTRFSLATALSCLLLVSSASAFAENGPPPPGMQPIGKSTRIITELGKGIGVVFSPDLATKGNRRFYEELGFAYFESPSWEEILDQVLDWNESHPDSKLGVLLMETHGTNGTGLKVQMSYDPKVDRSYISIGALQENLVKAGIHVCLVSACNTGRLFRPEIYNVLNPHPGDPLFLPPTRGIIDASSDFDASTAPVQMLRRQNSEIETLIEASYDELPPSVRKHLGTAKEQAGQTFVVSTMLIQLLTSDPSLNLVSNGFEEKKSEADFTEDQSEGLLDNFFEFLARTGGDNLAKYLRAREALDAPSHKPAAKGVVAKSTSGKPGAKPATGVKTAGGKSTTGKTATAKTTGLKTTGVKTTSLKPATGKTTTGKTTAGKAATVKSSSTASKTITGKSATGSSTATGTAAASKKTSTTVKKPAATTSTLP